MRQRKKSPKKDLQPEETTFANTVKALEAAPHELSFAWGLVTHLDSVCNSPELREAHNEMLPAVSAFFAKISLDPILWNSLQAFSKKEEANSLNSIDKRLLDETMRDFQEAGADLLDDKDQGSNNFAGTCQVDPKIFRTGIGCHQ